MRLLAMTVVVLFVSSPLQARVWTTVYRCDEKTPLIPVDPNYPHVYTDIMVGTKLAIVVSSDSNQVFSGVLEFLGDGVMSLTGRGFDPMLMTYLDSPLPASGKDSYVMEMGNEDFTWLNFSTDLSPSPGDWFVFDYCAERVGSCNLELYDANSDWSEPFESFSDWGEPIESLSFMHVPSCDFNRDVRVDLKDFAMLASHHSPATDSITTTEDAAFDLDSDYRIDLRDLAHFSRHWLERTTCDDPNQPSGL